MDYDERMGQFYVINEDKVEHHELFDIGNGYGLEESGFINIGKDTFYDGFKGTIKDLKFYHKDALTSQ